MCAKKKETLKKAQSLPGGDWASNRTEKENQPFNYSSYSLPARMILRELESSVYESTLKQLADYFSLFNIVVQVKMMSFFMDEFFGFGIPPLMNNQYTGIPIVDKLLMEMVDMICKDIEEKERDYER